MSKPTVSNNYIISTQGDNPIRVLEYDNQNNPDRVAVDLYCDQSISDDDDHRFQSYSTMFFGRQAKNFVNNFQPGDVVHVTGKLRVEIGEYTDLKIRDASWSFVPNGSNSQGQPQGQPQGSSAGHQAVQSSPQRAPQQAPPGGQQSPQQAPQQAPGGNNPPPQQSPQNASQGPPRPGN